MGGVAVVRLPKVANLLALAFSSVLLSLAAQEPAWNFDCVGYAGAARGWLEGATPITHRAVYEDLSRAAPRAAVDQIVRGSAYRKAVSEKPEVFALQLPLYQNKPLYVGLVAATTALGMNGISACFWISAVSFGAFALVFLTTALRLAPAWVAWTASALLLCAPPFLDLGRLATPDALAAAFSLGGVVTLVFSNRLRLGSVLLLLATLTRPDSILLVLAVVGWRFRDHLRTVRSGIVGALLAVTIAAITLGLSSQYSWSVLFQHTFGSRLLSVEQLELRAPTALEYWRTVRRGLSGDHVPHPTTAPLFGLVSVLACAVLHRHHRPRGHTHLHLAVWVAAVAHFLTFPLLADRFFAAHYATVVLLGLAAASEGSRRLDAL